MTTDNNTIEKGDEIIIFIEGMTKPVVYSVRETERNFGGRICPVILLKSANSKDFPNTITMNIIKNAINKSPENLTPQDIKQIEE